MSIEHGSVILISFVFGLMCIRYIRTYDIHEKEPAWKMLLATAWGGAWSVGVSLLLYWGVGLLRFEMRMTWLCALLGIGPIEEFGKLVAFLSCYFFISKELNEPTDGMIYMACVALGFSLIENVFYALDDSSADYWLLLLRSLLCTPLHILFSVFMGLGLYAWLKMRRGVWLLFVSFVYSSLVHGVYDGIVFGGVGIIVLVAIVLLLYRTALSFLEYSTAISPSRCSLASFVRGASGKLCTEGLECLHCGSTNPKVGYDLGDIHLQKCDNCPCYVTTKRGLGRIFEHFGSRFKSRDGEYHQASITGEKFSTLHRHNYISDEKELAFFYLEPLSEALEGINSAGIQAMQERRWFPELQKVDGNCLVLDVEGLLAGRSSPTVQRGEVIWSDIATSETYASAEYAVDVNADGEMELAVHYPHSAGLDGEPVVQKILIKEFEDQSGQSAYRFACRMWDGEDTCNCLVERLYLPIDTRLAGCEKCNGVTHGIQKKARLPQWRPDPSEPKHPDTKETGI